MTRENVMARLLRALSGLTQEQMADAIDVHPSLITQIELDQVTPSPEQLAGMARAAGITVPGAEELLVHYDTLRRSSRWRGGGLEELVQKLAVDLRDLVLTASDEILALQRADDEKAEEEDQRRAAELWSRLEKYPLETQLELVEVADEYQNGLLYERVSDLAEQEADPERAAGLERLARRILELAASRNP
ncbi:MAG TPA: helix-turn-helix transcriptional regulator [Thermoanaerobaculia bacterium]|nr:helix-turn-helix transcriptional regulator [Thermoanaerobaculia bacterium]